MGRRGKWFKAFKGCITADCGAHNTQDGEHTPRPKRLSNQLAPTPTAKEEARSQIPTGKEQARVQSPAAREEARVQIPTANEEARVQDVAQLPRTSSAVDVKQTSPKKEIKQSPSPSVSPSVGIASAVDAEAAAKLPTPQEDEQSRHAYSVALASAVAAEAAAVAAQAAAEVVRLTSVARVPGKPKEDIAATKIQTAFRGHQARKSLQSLRGMARLKDLVEGNSVKRQTENTLHSMQTLSRVQSKIQGRRLRMKEENLALQRQLQLKYERDLERLKIGEEWDGSKLSKEQIEARIANKYDAAIRRERALSYAFSHQWKAPSRAVTPMFTDAHNQQWSWSWLDHWMAARPWENQTTTDHTNDRASAKTVSQPIGAWVQKPIASRSFNLERTLALSAQKSVRPPSRQSPSKPSNTAGRKRPTSPRGHLRSPVDDDSRSNSSLRLDHRRRHSIAGSSMRDDVSQSSTSSVPSYLASTESTRAKSRFHSADAESLDKASICSVNKRLSFPLTDKQNTPNVRRHSGPPKL